MTTAALAGFVVGMVTSILCVRLFIRPRIRRIEHELEQIRDDVRRLAEIIGTITGIPVLGFLNLWRQMSDEEIITTNLQGMTDET